MKRALKLLYITLITLHLSSCLDMVNPSNYLGEGDVEVARVGVDSLYSMEIPKYMKKTAVLNDVASLQYKNARKEIYAIVIHESKKIIQETFEGTDDYNKNLTADKNYKNIQLGLIKENLTGFKKFDPEYLTINGLNASLIKIEGTVEGLNIFYQLGFIEGKENVFMIMTWTEKKKKNRFRFTFQKMIESFKLSK